MHDSTHCHRCRARWDVVGDAADAAYDQWTGWDRSGSSYYQGQRAQWPKAARQREMERQGQKPPTQAEECRAEARHTQEAGSRTIAADASTSSVLYGRRNYMDASCTADGTSCGSSGCNGTSSSCRFQLCPTSRIQAFEPLIDSLKRNQSTVPPPGGRVDDDLLSRPQAVTLLQTGPPLLADLGPSMHTEDQPRFIQVLYERWVGAGSFDRLLGVTICYLDGTDMPYNNQSRPVLLGDDFHQCIEEFRRAWHDLEDASSEIDFAVINHYADRDAINDSARRTNLEPLQVYIAGSGWEVLKALVTAYWRPSMDSM